MLRVLTGALAALTMLTGAALMGDDTTAEAAAPQPAGTGPAHQFSFTSIDGAPMSMGDFAGKAVLVVNTASRCGFTPQYDALQSVWETYRDRGLVVLGVPSNDFGGQEPGTEAQIKAFCETNFSVDFPMTEKQVVVGSGAHPFYRWAAEAGGADKVPSWNFHKYLIAPDGTFVAAIPTRVSPTDPSAIAAIEKALPQ
ncbi:glutathione peroxidase [Thalassobaculum salexigens]|uniref:glutathione peroxidase n=1 Tax=Thalassobaculum salexigens TaxID=455360 RepID=UPI0003FEE637|nr:glutathione peroxidase [Thalassobaculum salexigens]